MYWHWIQYVQYPYSVLVNIFSTAVKDPQDPKIELFRCQWGPYHSLILHAWTMQLFFQVSFGCVGGCFGVFFWVCISCFKIQALFTIDSCLSKPCPMASACTQGGKKALSIRRALVRLVRLHTRVHAHTHTCAHVVSLSPCPLWLRTGDALLWEGGLLDISQYCQNRRATDKILALEGFMLLPQLLGGTQLLCLWNSIWFKTPTLLSTVPLVKRNIFLLLFLDFFFSDTIPLGYCYFNKRGGG